MFYSDISLNTEKSWSNLINDLNEIKDFNPYCYFPDHYSIFKHLITSILLGKEIILLDSDFSQQEIEQLTGNCDISNFREILKKDEQLRINSKEELIAALKGGHQQWSITLFTSGTTGVPKKVKHSFESITRFVKYFSGMEQNVWGYAYNPTHMAGIQVFFQAVLNGNPMVRLFGLAQSEMFKSIERYGITHISATPTFYRLLTSAEKNFPTIKRITSGGEKFDKKVGDQMKILFPNAKITNVYASTEAGSLFAANGDLFSPKPKIVKFIKIENDELLIHRELLGQSDIKGTTVWYKTGDLVNVVTEIPLSFYFVSRQNEMINVGGYKVNPNEVEETIRNLNKVKNVRVFAKSNSVLGNIICCEIERNDDTLKESDIRIYLKSNLQEFKIPRMIKFVDRIKTTRTGKIKRK